MLERYFPWCDDWQKELKALFQQYVARKQERNVLDYDDLLLYWAQLAARRRTRRRRSAAGSTTSSWTSTRTRTASRPTSCRACAAATRNIMVVGDDAQSIYSFRAATVRNMLDFPKQFPGATVVTLEQNYRSVTPILETTNRVIAQAQERYTKDLWSARASGQRPLLVTCKDEAAAGRVRRRSACSSTTSRASRCGGRPCCSAPAHLSDSLELELTRRNIPYHKYGGLRFLEAAHVKDLIAFLRIVENPRDEMAWFRVLQLLDGVGPATAARAVQHVAEHGNDPRGHRPTSRRPPAAREAHARPRGAARRPVRRRRHAARRAGRAHPPVLRSASSRSSTRTRRSAHRDLETPRADRHRLPLAPRSS